MFTPTFPRISPRLGLLIIALFSIAMLAGFLTLDYMAPGGRRLVKIQGEDPVNYFGMAHSILFDHDFNLNNEYEHMPPAGRFWTMRRPETGLPGSPWGIGYSLLGIPLLALGTAIDKVAGNPADGYSRFAVYFYCLGSPIMTGIGLGALFRFLVRLGEHLKLEMARASAYALLAVFMVFFGTNVGYYAFSEMSHASTFLFASLFLFRWWQVRDSESRWSWFALGLIGGFLSICRWQDVLYLGGPLLYDLFDRSLARRASWWKSRLLYAAGIGLCWAPQLWQWKIIYGKFLTIPQGGGIFSFPPAHMLQVLFSSQSGWFIWTPITMLGVAGMLWGAWRETRVYLPWVVVLTLQTAVIGSVPFWSGVESFSARYMLSNTPIIGFGLMTAVCASGVGARRLLFAAGAACCAFTSVFALQFRLGLVPTETTLTFSELVTDKLRLPQVRERRVAAMEARQLLAMGNAGAAVELLEGARDLGEDRNIDSMLPGAYRAAGETAQADAAELRYKKFLDSRLY